MKKVITHDGGWYEADFTNEPTERDPGGCDGIYLVDIRIKNLPIGIVHAIIDKVKPER